MSLIKAAGSGEVSTGFYSHLLDQSLKFNDDDTQYLTRTPASAGNRQKFTYSVWFKRGNLSASEQDLFAAGNSSTDRFEVILSTAYPDQLQIYMNTGGTIGSLVTSQVFRDVSAFYHLVIAFDTTQGTAANRVKIYVNGSQITNFHTETYPSQNFNTAVNSTSNQYISKRSYVDDRYYDGYMAEINMIDGQQLTPASFGETKDGIWIPKDTSGLTFGTNGFHLTFKDDVVSEGFNTVTYTGNDSANSISGVGFSSDFVWIKQRNAAENHFLTDSVRGAGLHLRSDATTAESDNSATFTSFDGDGFSLTGTGSAAAQINDDGDTYVGWCWEAGGAPTADNSAGAGATPTAGSVKIDGSNLGSALAGTIPATRLSANTSKGFSVVTYTGTGSAGTIAHGLGAAPKWMIIKNRGVATWFNVYHTSLGATKYVRLNSNVAEQTNSNVFNNTEPTSSVFTVATVNDVNASGNTYVAYVWTEISGYSKFGSFTGNGGSQAIDVGFAPAVVLLKRTNSSSWGIFDNTRQPANTGLQYLSPNGTGAETTNANMVFSGNTFNDNGYVSDNGTTVLYMAFADTREAAFFKDVTTNGNHFTPVNLDYRDSVPDVPTNNFATLNPLFTNGGTTQNFKEGNLQFTADSNYALAHGTFAMRSGKWYWETYIKSYVAVPVVGISRGTNTADNSYVGYDPNGNVKSFGYEGGGIIYGASGVGTSAGSQLASGQTTYTTGDIIGCSFDADAGELKFYKNETLIYTVSSITEFDWMPATSAYNGGVNIVNFGQDSSFAGNHATSNANADGNGHGSFAYAPPSGFLALCSQNLPNVAIIDGTENFNTVLYTGNAGTQSITGVGFDPDFTWAKNRASGSYHHELYDTVRGDNKRVFSSQADVEATGYLQFISDGFSLTAGGGINANTNNHVAWNWLAGTAFSNDASATGVGTVDSAGQVNTTAGFSIVSYTGSTSESVGHGLSQAPECIFVKDRDVANNWAVYHQGVQDGTTNGFLELNATTAVQTGSNPRFLSGTAGTSQPTSTVFYVNNYSGSSTNTTGNDYIAYCFHSVEGYSKVGSYTGNGSTDGTFVHTGFKPAWIMLKESGNARNWVISYDDDTYYNGVTQSLFPNIAQAEDAYSGSESGGGGRLDFLSNGFKLRTTSTSWNNNGGNFIYLAFAESPFKFANAR